MRLRTANRCIALLRRLLLLPLLLPLLLLLLLLSLPSLPPLFTVVRHLPLVASLLLVNFNFNLNLNRLVLLHITTTTTLFLTALSRLLPRSILQPLPPLLRSVPLLLVAVCCKCLLRGNRDQLPSSPHARC